MVQLQLQRRGMELRMQGCCKEQQGGDGETRGRISHPHSSSYRERRQQGEEGLGSGLHSWGEETQSSAQPCPLLIEAAAVREPRAAVSAASSSLLAWLSSAAR